MEENKNNSTSKRNLLAALILTFAFIIIGVSGSYAYFVNAVKEVNPGNQGVSVQSGELTLNFATVNSKYINATSAKLINDSDIATSNDYTSFSVTLPGDAKVGKASYDLFLTDIKMTSNFKSTYLKWALYNSSDVKVADGNFNGVTLSSTADSEGYYTASNIILKSGIDITKGENNTSTTNSYKLYIWLSNDSNVQQNDLLNGKLSAKVGFRGISKA